MRSYPVLSKQAKEHGKSAPPMRELETPKRKETPTKNVVARYEVRV